MYRDGGSARIDHDLTLTRTRIRQEPAFGQLYLVRTGCHIYIIDDGVAEFTLIAFSVINFLMMFFAPVCSSNHGRKHRGFSST